MTGLAAIALALAAQDAPRDGALPPAGGAEAARAAASSDGLARRSADLPRAAPGAHSGWRATKLPPLYDLAVAAYRADDAPRAIRFLVLLLERRPDEPAATLLLGGMYFRLRRYEDAVDAYERFLLHAPEELVRTRQLAHALYSLGRYEEAERHYSSVLELPESEGGLAGEGRAHAWRGLGLSRRQAGRLDEALAAFRAALRAAPDDVEALLATAQLLEELGVAEEALVHARRARDLAPFDPRPAYLLSVLHEDAGRAEDAARERAEFERLAPAATVIRELETVLLGRPGDADALAGLARAHASIGDVASARAALQRLGGASLEHALLALELLAPLDPGASDEAARYVATRFASEPAAWDALARHYALRSDEAAAEGARARAKRLREPDPPR